VLKGIRLELYQQKSSLAFRICGSILEICLDSLLRFCYSDLSSGNEVTVRQE